jgi:ribonuclease HI
MFLVDYHRRMKELVIYTDGGCSGNPGPGGWAYALAPEGREDAVTGSGHDRYTTNNKMELTAVIEALTYAASLGQGAVLPVHIHTDSQYVKNGITTWIFGWMRNGWQTSAKKPVKNRELWIELKRVSDTLPVQWHWVKGHSGVALNELCDALVREQTQIAQQLVNM